MYMYLLIKSSRNFTKYRYFKQHFHSTNDSIHTLQLIPNQLILIDMIVSLLNILPVYKTSQFQHHIVPKCLNPVGIWVKIGTCTYKSTTCLSIKEINWPGLLDESAKTKAHDVTAGMAG